MPEDKSVFDDLPEEGAQAMKASVDCDPDTLNLQSRGGWITCYVELPGRDPRDIDADTVLLNDVLSPELDSKYGFVSSESSYIVDNDADGVEERMFKFDRGDVVDLIGSPSDAVELEITGKLTDGTEFRGSDSIRAIGPPIHLPVDKLGTSLASDLDNDGDEDLIVSGQEGTGRMFTRVYENKGGSYLPGQTLVELVSSAMAAGDLNGDGRLDIVLMGGRSNCRQVPEDCFFKVYLSDSFIYPNATLEAFPPPIFLWEDPAFGENVQAVPQGDLVLGDINMDGSLDVIVSGKGSRGKPDTKIYLNTGSQFVESRKFGKGLVPLEDSALALGDLDLDGDLDLVAVGEAQNHKRVARVYENTGTTYAESESFEENLLSLNHSNLELADFDLDRRPDLIMLGTESDEVVGDVLQAIVFLNVNDTFQENPSYSGGLIGPSEGSLSVGDLDNDGDPDVVLAGDTPKGVLIKVYLNVPGGLVEYPFFQQILPGVHGRSTIITDVDGDGDNDLVIPGEEAGDRVIRVLENVEDWPRATQPSKYLLKGFSFDPIVEGIPSMPPALTLPASQGYYIVQFVDRTQQVWKDSLRALGATFLEYIPNNAFIVFMPPGIESAVRQLPYVRWLGLYHPAYKIEQDLLQNTGAIELNVVVFDDAGTGVNLIAARTAIQQYGGTITYDGSSNYIIEATIQSSKIIDVAFIPEVEWVDESGPPENDMDIIRGFVVGDALDIGGFDGTGIVGEVMDDGIDETHPDFVGRITIDGAHDQLKHGTATFGILFGSGLGDAGATGMLPGAEGIFVDRNTSRMTRTHAAENLVRNYGGLFQSHSWGGERNNNYTSRSRENDDIVFNLTITVTQSMSNHGRDPWPNARQEAMSKNIIAVGGIFHYDKQNRAEHCWERASVGPARDGRIKPDLIGPYDRIYTTDCTDTSSCENGGEGYAVGNYTAVFRGTSGATPVVAGAAGLVYEMYIADHFGNNPAGNPPNPSTVKALLINNAYQYDLQDQATRYQQGWGIVDVESIYSVGPDHFIVDEDVSLLTGQKKTYTVTSDGSTPLKVTLVWTDRPASPSANLSLVNNLDLELVAPNGAGYYGNMEMETSRWTTPGKKVNDWFNSTAGGDTYRDNLNNVENVFVQNPAAGKWKIIVRAEDVPMDGDTDTPAYDDQPFALLVQGGSNERSERGCFGPCIGGIRTTKSHLRQYELVR